jgi:hypothetical protein
MPIDLAVSPTVSTERTLADILAGTINHMKAQFNNGQQIVWANPWLLTPQQVFDIMGTNATQQVMMSGGLMQLINGSGVLENGVPIQVVGMMPADKDMQFNADGTVTVVDKG